MEFVEALFTTRISSAMGGIDQTKSFGYLHSVSNLNFTMLPIIIGAALIIVLFFAAIGLYNKLVKLRNGRENAFANIDVLLKKRHDMIPQLVQTVKGYMDHEADTLIKVTEARAAAMGATTINGKIEAEQTLSRRMGGFMLAVERYPDLKANENFMHLQREISNVESELQGVRFSFNDATRRLNDAVETFPSSVFAGMGGFQREPMFDLGIVERELLDTPPEISFD